MTDLRMMSSLTTSGASCRMITDKIVIIINTRVSAEPGVGSSRTILEGDAISWGSL